jgi:hypothetical protein
MITKEVLDNFYNNSKSSYEESKKLYEDTHDEKFLKTMCAHSGEMVICKKLLKLV